MKSRQIGLIALFVFAFLGSTLAQMAGNPAGVRGRGEWTIGVDGTYMTQQQGSANAITRRLFLKSNWGVAPWLDCYGMIGGVQLELRPVNSEFTNYKDNLRLGFGAGFNAAYPSPIRSSFSFWAGGQFMRFTSEGIFANSQSADEMGYTHEFEMNYDWREFRGNLGVIINVSFVQLYAAAAGWAVQRLEGKSEYLSGTDAHIFIGKTDGEYRSGFWWGALAGFEFKLPMRYTIGIEMTYFNSYNYFIVAGISQTGILTW